MSLGELPIQGLLIVRLLVVVVLYSFERASLSLCCCLPMPLLAESMFGLGADVSDSWRPHPFVWFVFDVAIRRVPLHPYSYSD